MLPLVADATASSASLAADTAPQSGSPQLQQRSSAKHSRDEQQSSSTHWAQQVIKVMRGSSCQSPLYFRVICQESALQELL